MNVTDINIGLNETSPFMSSNITNEKKGLDPFYHFKTQLVSNIVIYSTLTLHGNR